MPQGCNVVKTRLARALLPSKPAPAQTSSARQNVVSRARDISVVFDFEKVYDNDDITFFSRVLTFAQAIV